MSQTRQLVVMVSKTKIQAGEVSLGTMALIENAVETEWNPQIVTDIFKQLKERYKTDELRIVFGEDISFVACVAIPKGKDINREYVKLAFEQNIPISLDQTKWDYKDVFTRNDNVIVQVAALLNSYVDSTVLSAEAAGFNIFAMEPASYALSRLTENEQHAHISIFQGEQILIVGSLHGLVLASEITSKSHIAEIVRVVVRRIREHYGLDVSHAVLSDNMGNDVLRRAGYFNIKNIKLHPMLGIAMKSDIISKDKEVLNTANQKDSDSVLIHTINRQPSQEVFQKTSHPTLKNKINIPFKKFSFYVVFTLLAIFLFLLIVGIVVRMRTSKGSTSISTQTLPTAIPTIVPTPSPTTEPIKTEIYKIRILNGTGIKGEANKVKLSLERIGFKQFNTGNADSYNFTNSILRLKEGVPPAVYDTIKKTLESEYSVTLSDEILTKNYAYDVIITIGQRNK